LGGDGRAASVHSIADFKPTEPDERDYGAIAESRRCRLVLTTPGLFPEGWKLPGLDSELNWQLDDVCAKLVAAAVPRAEVVSGWDLAQWQPKPAQRVAPAGSVYWLEDLSATPDALRKLAGSGLWLSTEDNSSRRAEGFNRFTFAAA
jgi:CRISPR-associated protein Cmr3